MSAIDAVVGQPWAIQPDWLEAIAAIAQRQFDAPPVVALQGRAPRAGEPGLQITDGVAVIGIIGPIFPRANMMTENSGATSLAKVQAQFRAALADPGVSSIVFNIDSPGGAVTGIGDFAAEVAAARKAKPILAVAAGMCCSAAYWIASAASRIVVSRTAMVGSIGVVVGASKQVAPDADGYITVDIVSSNAPGKRTDPTDSAGRAAIVAMLDAFEVEFIASVAANRGVSVETVKADFGKGGVLIGAAAVAAGMADRIATIDFVLVEQAGAGSTVHLSTRAAPAAASEKDTMSNPASVSELIAAFPDLVAQIRRDATANLTSEAAAAARIEGATAERERILGIEKNALPGHEALVATFKADGKTSPAEAAVAILQAEKATGGRVLSTLAADGAEGPAVTTAAAPRTPATPSTPDGWKAEFAASAELQSEFPTADHYANYMAGVASGRIRRLVAKA